MVLTNARNGRNSINVKGKERIELIDTGYYTDGYICICKNRQLRGSKFDTHLSHVICDVDFEASAGTTTLSLTRFRSSIKHEPYSKEFRSQGYKRLSYSSYICIYEHDIYPAHKT